MTRHDPTDLFAADSYAMDAAGLLVRAVTAGENDRWSEQRALVEQATSQLAKALSKLNPATVSAPVGRA